MYARSTQKPKGGCGAMRSKAVYLMKFSCSISGALQQSKAAVLKTSNSKNSQRMTFAQQSEAKSGLPR